MSQIKRITANLPENLLKDAISVTQLNLTDTLIQGLKLIKRTAAFEKAQNLKGKIEWNVDLNSSRERSRR